MAEHGHQRKVERSIRYARVWSEDGKNAGQAACHEQWLLVKSDRQARHIRRRVEPEDAKEEFAEGIEHLNEEIPPESHVGCEIRQEKTHTVCRRQEVP